MKGVRKYLFFFRFQSQKNHLQNGFLELEKRGGKNAVCGHDNNERLGIENGAKQIRGNQHSPDRGGRR